MDLRSFAIGLMLVAPLLLWQPVSGVSAIAPQEVENLRRFDRDSWDKLTRDIDYTQAPQEQPESEQEPRENVKLPAWQNFGALLSYTVLGVIILALLWYLIKYVLPGFERVKKDGVSPNVEELEDIAELDLTGLIAQAEARSNWKEAVRLYFLLTLQKLSEKGRIMWDKDKTNREYLREMRSTPQFPEFRSLTRHFEFAQYGDAEVKREEFDNLKPRFRGFIRQFS